MAPRLTVAAGVVALDCSATEPRVLLVHRPGYDDWSLPKGKLHRDETLISCAYRETIEETGVTPRLGPYLGTMAYPVGGGTKEVHYWVATPLEMAPRTADDEVDKVVWLPVRTAMERMSYGDERAMVDKALAFPPTTPMLIVRHAKALERKNWGGADEDRPIGIDGRAQAQTLVDDLLAYGVRRLDSSTSTRCVQTLDPYAAASGLEVQGWPELSEELASDETVTTLIRRLASETSKGTPSAVCGHRPVLPTMLAAVGVDPRPMQPSAIVVAHLDAAGAVVGSEFHKPLA